ncbi:MAG: hypothetical protein A2Y12_04515 [Planctomycetes bacterium GWF2_42_9]|nr:MAG: hypothetical protein A2Y12_04515 [Planctomycetes bacterium GWF2_42_9]HAL45210.1 hypothetical protein [Phycisphaerales bacterium]
MKKALFIFLTLIASVAFGGIKYHPTDLTKVATDNSAPIIPSYGYAINDACMVAGHGVPPGNTNAKPYLYNPATGYFVNIGNLAGDFNGDGYGGNGYSINNQGFVTGRDSNSSTAWQYRAFLYHDANSNGVVDPCELANLNPEGGSNTGNDINNRNQVVGYNSTTSTGWVWTDLNSNNKNDDGEKQYFSGLNPMSINDSGTILLSSSGTLFLWSDLNSNGIYEETEKQTMSMPTGGTSMTGNSINNNGDVCGYFKNSSAKNQGFYWTDSNHNGIVESSEYDVFGAAVRNTYVRAMNNRGEVVGGTYEWDIYSSLRSAFVWSVNTGIINLNTSADSYTDPTLGIPVIYSQAEGINNAGVITVTGWFDVNGDGKKGSSDPEHVFVVKPYIPGDLDNSNYINFTDYNILSALYGSTDCTTGNNYCSGKDINNDGSVDLKDIKILLDDWLLDIR